jgi:hypothetical protein
MVQFFALVSLPTRTACSRPVAIGGKGSLGRASPCQGCWPARGKLGTPDAPLNEMRLAHLPLKRHHDVGMGVGEDKLVKRGVSFPDGESPELLREEPRPQRVPEQARSPSQLPPDAPRVAQERAQIASALHREFGQQDQVFPLRVWSVQCEPWLRWHWAASGAQELLRLLRYRHEAADRVFLNLCRLRARVILCAGRYSSGNEKPSGVLSGACGCSERWCRMAERSATPNAPVRDGPGP